MQTCQKSIFNVNFTCIITNKPIFAHLLFNSFFIVPLKECSEIVANYYSDITKLEDIEQIDFLIGRCALFFAEKVHSIPLPQNLDQSLLSSIHFIRQNVYSSLTVDDVAQQLGYSRSHTSKLFMKSLDLHQGNLLSVRSSRNRRFY